MKKKIKRITRSIVTALLALVLLSVSSLGVFADGTEEILPYYVTENNHKFELTVTSSGASFSAYYRGNPSTFIYAELSVKLQKKVLGIFWSTVDIGEPDNIWTHTATIESGTFSDTLPIDGSGTYRATFTLKIYETGGTVDEIEEIIEREYQ